MQQQKYTREQVRQWIKDKQYVSWHIVEDLLDELESSEERIIRQNKWIDRCDLQLRQTLGESYPIMETANFFDTVEAIALKYESLHAEYEDLKKDFGTLRDAVIEADKIISLYKEVTNKMTADIDNARAKGII